MNCPRSRSGGGLKPALGETAVVGRGRPEAISGNGRGTRTRTPDHGPRPRTEDHGTDRTTDHGTDGNDNEGHYRPRGGDCGIVRDGRRCLGAGRQPCRAQSTAASTDRSATGARSHHAADPQCVRLRSAPVRGVLDPTSTASSAGGAGTHSTCCQRPGMFSPSLYDSAASELQKEVERSEARAVGVTHSQRRRGRTAEMYQVRIGRPTTSGSREHARTIAAGGRGKDRARQGGPRDCVRVGPGMANSTARQGRGTAESPAG